MARINAMDKEMILNALKWSHGNQESAFIVLDLIGPKSRGDAVAAFYAAKLDYEIWYREKIAH
jgi:hypothetical protein